MTETVDPELLKAARAPWFGDCAMCATARGIRTSLWYGDSEEEVRGRIKAHIAAEHPDLIRAWPNGKAATEEER